jgi:spermidine synthase
VFFVSGFTALASEVIWTRILTIYIRGSVLGLAVVLSTFLSGIALGSLLSRWVRRPGLVVYGVLFWLIGISSLIAAAAVDAIYQALFPRLISYGGVVVLSVVLMFTTTMLYGMVFPIGVQLYTAARRQLGAAVSLLYFVNTVGGALGSLCAGFLFVPLLGLHNAIIVIAFLNFEVAAFLLLRDRRRATTVLAFSGFAALIAAAVLPVTHRYINKAFASGEYVYYREGNDATVAVVEDAREDRPYHALLVDGQFVAGTQGAMEIDSKLLAHIPLLVHPHPQTALTVGFGAGGTSFSMLEHGLERVDVVEIEPAVVAANQFFLDLNFDVIHNPRLRVILEDARNYLLLTKTRYDVISTDVTNIRYRSNSSLYTREYFALLQSRLAPGGVAAAWIPLSELTERDLQTLLRTFQDVFPHTTLWYSQSKMDHFAVLVGTSEPLTVDFAALQPRVRGVLPDLSRVHAYNAYVFINMLMLDEAGVRAVSAGAPVHRDLRPVLDFTAPSDIPRDVWYRNLRQVAALRTTPERHVTHASLGESALIGDYDALARILLDGHLSILQGRTSDGERFYRQAFDVETRLKAAVEADSSSPHVRPAEQVW